MLRVRVSFAEVKQRVSLPEVLRVFGIAESFARKGDRLSGICPLPGHQHGPSPNPQQFKMDMREGVWVWHCFGDCHRGGDVIEFVKAMTGYDDAHVRFWFAEHFPDRIASTTATGKQKDRVEKGKAREPRHSAEESQASPSSTANLPGPSAPLKPLGFRLRLEPDVPYLRSRGLTNDTIAEYGLGVCRRGVLAGYVAIPIDGWPRENGSNPVGYIGRWPGDDFDDEHPRYKVPHGFEISRVVYGLPQALGNSDERDPLIVVEGPFKVFHLVQCGFPNTSSCCTASVSDEQAKILGATGRPILLLFDGNEAGRDGARRAAERLLTRAYVRIADLPEGIEPDDLSPTELHDIVSPASSA